MLHLFARNRCRTSNVHDTFAVCSKHFTHLFITITASICHQQCTNQNGAVVRELWVYFPDVNGGFC